MVFPCFSQQGQGAKQGDHRVMGMLLFHWNQGHSRIHDFHQNARNVCRGGSHVAQISSICVWHKQNEYLRGQDCLRHKEAHSRAQPMVGVRHHAYQHLQPAHLLSLCSCVSWGHHPPPQCFPYYINIYIDYYRLYTHHCSLLLSPLQAPTNQPGSWLIK